MLVLTAVVLGSGCSTQTVAPGTMFEVSEMTVTTDEGSDQLSSETTEIEVCCDGNPGPVLEIVLKCDAPDIDLIPPALTIHEASPNLTFSVAGPERVTSSRYPDHWPGPGDFAPFLPAQDSVELESDKWQWVILQVSFSSCGFETAGFAVELTALPDRKTVYEKERRRFDIVNTCYDSGTLTLNPSRAPLGTQVYLTTDVDFFDVGMTNHNEITFTSPTNSVTFGKGGTNAKLLIVQVPTCPLGEGETPSWAADFVFDNPDEGLVPADGVASVFEETPRTVPVTIEVKNSAGETREGTFTYEPRLVSRELHQDRSVQFGGIAARDGIVYLTAYEDIRTVVLGEDATTLSDGAPGSGVLEGIGVDAGRIMVANDGLYGVQSVDAHGVRTLIAESPDFSSPFGIALGPVPEVYVTDVSHSRVSRIDGDGVTVLAGGGPQLESGYVDGVGQSARFNYPQGIARDPAGDLYIADRNNEAIRKITLPPRSTEVTVSTLLGGPGSGAPAYGVAVDGEDNLYATSASNLYVLLAGSTQLVQLTQFGAPMDYPELLTQVVTVRLESYDYGGHVAVDERGMVYLAMTSTAFRIAAE
jgi:hypothetical protein